MLARKSRRFIRAPLSAVGRIRPQQDAVPVAVGLCQRILGLRSSKSNPHEAFDSNAQPGRVGSGPERASMGCGSRRATASNLRDPHPGEGHGRPVQSRSHPEAVADTPG
jgi:hypothetical protein